MNNSFPLNKPVLFTRSSCSELLFWTQHIILYMYFFCKIAIIVKREFQNFSFRSTGVSLSRAMAINNLKK